MNGHFINRPEFVRPERSGVPIVGQVINLTYKVATLVNGFKTAGYYEVNFDASRLASGVYFYKIKTGNNVATKKMLLAK